MRSSLTDGCAHLVELVPGVATEERHRSNAHDHDQRNQERVLDQRCTPFARPDFLPTVEFSDGCGWGNEPEGVFDDLSDLRPIDADGARQIEVDADPPHERSAC